MDRLSVRLGRSRGPTHTNEVKLCLAIGMFSEVVAKLALFGLKKLVGAVEGEDLVGGAVDVGNRNVRD